MNADSYAFPPRLQERKDVTMGNPTAFMIALWLATMTLPFNSPAADEAFWTMGIALDSPDLATPAVQWAIFNEDPVPEFKERMARYRSAYQKEDAKGTKRQWRMREIRSARITGDWDRSFKRITGDKMNLLTGAPGHSQGYSSDGDDGQKWIVTKIVSIHGTPVCWCLPVEVRKGETIQIKLTEKNRFDLLEVCESVMNEPEK